VRTVETRALTRDPSILGNRSGWFFRKAGEPLMALLRTGLSPTGLAWSVAAGLALGVFPVLGSTTLLCLVAGLVFGLNQPALQLANYLAYPLQVVLLIPFYRLGGRLFGIDPGMLSLSVLFHSFKLDAAGTLVHLWSMIWHAMVIWTFLAVPAMLLLAFMLRPVFAEAVRRFGPAPEDRGTPSGPVRLCTGLSASPPSK